MLTRRIKVSGEMSVQPRFMAITVHGVREIWIRVYYASQLCLLKRTQFFMLHLDGR